MYGVHVDMLTVLDTVLFCAVTVSVCLVVFGWYVIGMKAKELMLSYLRGR